MLKKLLCTLLGHKFTVKNSTSEHIPCNNYVKDCLLYRWEQLTFCPRCGTINPNYEGWRRMRETWDKIQP